MDRCLLAVDDIVFILLPPGKFIYVYVTLIMTKLYYVLIGVCICVNELHFTWCCIQVCIRCMK